MERRSFLGLPALTLACGEAMSRFPQFGPPPWHMWGNSQTLQFNGGTGVQGQLVRINYARPDTFRFLFTLKLLSNLTDGQFAQANFIVIPGIGRTQTELNPFATLFIRAGAGGAPAGTQVWRTSVMQPPMEVVPGVPELVPTDIIIAQDLQCTVQFFGTADLNIQAEVSAMFAPNVHVRPEWYLSQEQNRFRGEELNGT